MSARTHTNTHTHSHYDALMRWDFTFDLKDVSVFDDLTFQRRLFQTESAA